MECWSLMKTFQRARAICAILVDEEERVGGESMCLSAVVRCF